ncbi:DUF5979 domain-containing protein [uncultured Dubosiella sp.]|uniref:DUF5979 domain-containing protein n=6 Tax=uncultured Dubosiella sp. TaxID=1937011 RepID=UPI00272E4F5D|nr:DUF5979 domain-containing protein [uncultured Dubosiella sp.]
MKRKKLGWIIGLVALVFALGLPAISRTLAVDLKETCSLSFSPLPEYADDLESADVVVDVFKVASAIEDPGVDSYSFEATETFEALAPALKNLAAVDYTALSQQAGQIVAQSKPELVATVSVLDKARLEPGLYLTMPRRADMTLADSLEQTMVGSTDGTEKVLSFVNTSQYKYTFNPSLVALPSRMDENGENNTVNGTDWQYDFTMTLKASQEPREDGRIVIHKQVDALGGFAPAMFVFEITAEYDGEVVYSGVEQLVLTDTTSGTIEVDNIPVGSVVTVEEVYTGASYTLVSGSPSQELADGDVELTFDFVNALVPNNNHGTSVNNTFTRNGESWDVNQRYSREGE